MRPGFDPWVGKISRRRERLPTPVFCPEESHGQGSVVGLTKSQTQQNNFHFTVKHIRFGLKMLGLKLGYLALSDSLNFLQLQFSSFSK